MGSLAVGNYQTEPSMHRRAHAPTGGSPRQEQHVRLCLEPKGIYPWVHVSSRHVSSRRVWLPAKPRPISLLRFVDSIFPENFSMGLGIPTLRIKIMLESNPLKSRILVQRLAVELVGRRAPGVRSGAQAG